MILLFLFFMVSEYIKPNTFALIALKLKYHLAMPSVIYDSLRLGECQNLSSPACRRNLSWRSRDGMANPTPSASVSRFRTCASNYKKLQQLAPSVLSVTCLHDYISHLTSSPFVFHVVPELRADICFFFFQRKGKKRRREKHSVK